jgi:heptaprenyl diphosphate synthase
MAKRVPFMGMILALALILSYIESLIPFFYGVPGMKLGLTNLLVVLLLYLYDGKSALFINVLRIILVGFLFGNAFSILYSLAGCLLSFACMCFAKRFSPLSMVSVSIIGGITHNLGQVIVACFVVSNYHLLLYFPILFLGGLLTGLLIGCISGFIYPALHQFIRTEGEKS